MRSFDGNVAVSELSALRRRDLDKFARAVRLIAVTRKERAAYFGFSMYKMRLIECGRYLAPDFFDIYIEFGAIPIPGWIIKKYYAGSLFKARFV